MTAIVEDRQTLQFDASWRVTKWDEADEFVAGLQPTLHQLRGGIKAADIIGVRTIPRRQRTLLLAELKDFAHPKHAAGSGGAGRTRRGLRHFDG